jgi:hypothetical protein
LNMCLLGWCARGWLGPGDEAGGGLELRSRGCSGESGAGLTYHPGERTRGPPVRGLLLPLDPPLSPRSH